jgi:hypothetical protein
MAEPSPKPDKVDWCPEHVETPDGCPICEWLANRSCGCDPGLYCLRCNRVSMMAVLKKRGHAI